MDSYISSQKLPLCSRARGVVALFARYLVRGFICKFPLKIEILVKTISV